MKHTLILIALFMLFSCANDAPTTDQKESERQEQLQAEGQRQAGLPAIHNFQEKKLLKMIYELRDDEKIVNYAYLYVNMTGALKFLGKCIGYGIPYSTQYSNPEKLYNPYSSRYEYMSLPQAEPNGLFMPTSSQGTWIMLLDKEGKPHPVYCEPEVIVSPFPLQ